MVKYLAGLALLAATGVITCCGGSDEPLAPGESTGGQVGTLITTDRQSYSVERSGSMLKVTIGLTLRNTGASTIYLPQCKGIESAKLQKRVGDAWVVAFDPAVPLCADEAVAVQPDESHSYEFRIVAGAPGTTAWPPFEVSELSGTYRVDWLIFRSWDASAADGDLLAPEERVSNSFQLVEG